MNIKKKKDFDSLQREELIALCVSYDQLINQMIMSRRRRVGEAIVNVVIRSSPRWLVNFGLSALRHLAKNASIAKEKSRFEIEFDELHQRLTNILFLPGSPMEAGILQPSTVVVGSGQAPRSVSIVSVLYNSEQTIEIFLDAWRSQKYEGRIEIVLVDDASSDHSVSVATAYAKIHCTDRFDIKIIENVSNIGNCASRNKGVGASTGDIVVIIDCDCIVNAEFASAHAELHALGYDAVIGPMGLECGIDGLNRLQREVLADKAKLTAAMKLQYHPRPASFVNSVTRNFSVTREALEGLERPLFDERFSYRDTPDTGFGWEDVEMGAALFEAGASIAFAWNAVSIHLSHPPSVSDKVKAFGSLKNFDLLLESHPKIASRYPHWFRGTAQKIGAWVANYDPKHPALPRLLGGGDPGGLEATPSGTVLYSAIAGGYDRPKAQQAFADVESILFYDGPEAPQGWDVEPFDVIANDPVRTAKKPKILPHVYFPQPGWSVWVDGNIELLVSPHELIDEVRDHGATIGVFRHPDRRCIYKEAARCISASKDDPSLIISQMERYREEGYPADNGLAECNVIVRHHSDPLVQKVMSDWWREIRTGSRRDQLSFNYVIWKNSYGYHELNNGKTAARNDSRFRCSLHVPAMGV